MREELNLILEKIKLKIADDSNMVWTGYDSAKELRDEIDVYINQIKNGDLNGLADLNTYFLPTSTFQEHSISNGWPDEYLRLAEEFDKIYHSLKGKV